MKIYGFPLSPFVRKVVVAAREKGLDYELVPANPSQPTEEFLKISPFSKIPALSDGDFCLADSTAIVTYLEAKHPQPPLLPAEPQARGRAIWFEEVADTVLTPAGAPIVLNRFVRPKIFGTEGDEAAAQAAEEAIKSRSATSKARSATAAGSTAPFRSATSPWRARSRRSATPAGRSMLRPIPSWRNGSAG